MRRFLLTIGLFCLSSSCFAGVQSPLPTTFAGWSAAGVQGVKTSVSPALAEYGFMSAEVQSYQRGADVLQVERTTFKDPSGAYGAYSYLITPDLKRTDLAEHSSISPDRALILIGNAVLDIQGKGLPADQAGLKALVTAVQLHVESGPLPTLWQHLPEKGFVPRSDRYILGPQTLDQLFPVGIGDSLGFSKGAEAELGQYKLNGRDFSLLIVDYPTPGFAMQQLSDLQKQFNINGSKSGSAVPPLFAKRDYTLLAIVSGASSQADANLVLGQVQSGTQLTWDEPTFQFKEPSIEMMIVGSIIGAGIICGFALVAGLAFGGFRLFMKRLMPGRVFDRTEQIQVLQLGLVSKPINAEDFYGSVGTTAGTVTVDKNLPDRVALRLFR